MTVFTREQSVQFEWSFELRIIRMTVFGPCVRTFALRCVIWIAQFKSDGPEVFSNDASLKSRSEIAVWMPWPVNCDLGVELRDLLTTSAYISCAAYVQKHRKCELHACLIGRVPRHEPRFFSCTGMLNPKFGFASSLVCMLRNSNIAITILHCNFESALVWKQSISLGRAHYLLYSTRYLHFCLPKLVW